MVWDKHDANFLSGTPRSRENALLPPIIYRENEFAGSATINCWMKKRLAQWMAEKSGQYIFTFDH